ncbi:MAG TPA: response regulator [Polyangia bacterium]|nr:response regulator [Polyangia bacterium]
MIVHRTLRGSGGTLNILLVDDDPDILRIVSRMLARNGHQVGTCESPFGVAAVVLRSAPDIVILDVQMPGLTGPALAGVIAKLNLPKRPLLALWSSIDDDGLRKAAEEAGGVPTISKAVRPTELVAAIERIGAQRTRV